MNRSITLALGTLLALSPALTAACLTSPGSCSVPLRTPRGIYAVVNIKEYANLYDKANALTTPASNAVIEAYLHTTVYPGLLSNPDVSGIVLYVNWSWLNPNQSGPNAYDWNPISDLLTQAGKAMKTVQLVVTPGINSPQWLLGSVGMNNGILYTCDYLFTAGPPKPPAGKTCGKVTFSGFDEGGYNKATMTAYTQQQPMPWDSTYKNAWHTFLNALATQFGSNLSLVSIAVAGPTASSEEMILPTSQNTYGGKDGPYGGKGGPQLGGYTAEQMWNKLLADHYTSAYTDSMKYQDSDVAFMDEWANEIDFYGKTFSKITLTMSTGDGLPKLDAPLPTDVPCDLNKQTCSFTMPMSPIPFVCVVADMDCAAETTILNYFIQFTVGGPNAKAVMTDGMKGGAVHGNLSVPNVKLISLNTDLYTSPSQRILGGAQFATRFSTDNTSVDLANSDEGGCTSCTAEQALYNVLTWFFDKTSQGPNFPTGSVPKVGGNSGSAPLNYLQIYGPDITYATTDTFGRQPVMGCPNPMSAQDLLHKASLALALVAEY